jgi:DNA-binding NtrC family response regulator
VPAATDAAPQLLVIDDEPGITALLERFGAQLGFVVESRGTGAEGLAALASIRPNVALVDLRLPELNGIDVLRSIKVSDPECQVILMTGEATVDTAIEAVKAGALDYVSKPFDMDRLRQLLVGVREGLQRRRQLLEAEADTASRFEFHGMSGRGAEMQQIFDSIQRLAPHVRTVLVTGETGTGKELVAKALHRCGRRRDKRFVTVNCSAVVETLFESELFGHVRGAFTGATDNKVGLFEHADGGTLFLDEAGELPMGLQAKLLRAVEYGEIQRVGAIDTRKVDVCVIAATNRDLRAETASGRFRSDLYYRLSVIELRLPPLRDRREDVPYLSALFIRDNAARLQRPISGMSPGAEKLLQRSLWPGNIRELKNAIERACIMSDGRLLTERDIATAMATPSAQWSGHVSGNADAQIDADTSGNADPALLSTAQREQIRRVLKQTNGNKAAAAKLLGVSRRSLYRWLERLAIEP